MFALSIISVVYSWGLADSADWAPPKSLSEQSAAVSGAVDTKIYDK
jgi:hypothetical protein